MAGSFLALAAGWLLIPLLLVLARHAGEMLALWREPVLRFPVLIFESDDWGPGPADHAGALARLSALLTRFQDREGRSPVLTLGLTLAAPDGERMAAEGFETYRRRLLSDPACAPVLGAIREGMAAGVFAAQLHGMEHFWGPALVREEGLRAWLTGSPFPATEALPPAWQSRWAGSLTTEEIHAAATEEARTFREILGAPPRVAVPPTFVWGLEVERAWREEGVAVVMTPGRRYGDRDAAGELVPEGPVINNGEISSSGCLYLVRGRYFEPSMGHGADHGAQEIRESVRLGRPALLETHRMNYIASTDDALTALEELLERALAEHPDLRFMATETLADRLRKDDFLEKRFSRRLRVWMARVGELAGVRKLARLSGLFGLLRLVYRGLR